MAYQRGDVVLIPFPFTNLTATKTRPAVVISSATYHSARPDLLLAYCSSQVSKAVPPLDYLLVDWKSAGLPKPSFVRPKLASIEPMLIVHHVGQLSAADLFQVDRCLRVAMALTQTVLPDMLAEIDLLGQPPALVQMLAEKTVKAIIKLNANQVLSADPDRLRSLLATESSI